MSINFQTIQDSLFALLTVVGIAVLFAVAIIGASGLVQRDKVDVLIGTVHSGVQMGIQKVARDSGVLSLIPNAGVHAATRSLCAPNVFRTSFTNSQPTLALGKPFASSNWSTATPSVGSSANVVAAEAEERRGADPEVVPPSLEPGHSVAGQCVPGQVGAERPVPRVGLGPVTPRHRQPGPVRGRGLEVVGEVPRRLRSPRRVRPGVGQVPVEQVEQRLEALHRADRVGGPACRARPGRVRRGQVAVAPTITPEPTTASSA